MPLNARQVETAKPKEKDYKLTDERGLFLLERVLGDVWGLRLWSLLAIAFFGWAFVLRLKAHSGWARALQLLLLAALLIAARPLQDWAFNGNTQQIEIKHLTFQPVANLPQLQAALAQAQGKEVPTARVTGFMNTAEFLAHLQQTMPR